jgi:hypothetical protein
MAADHEIEACGLNGSCSASASRSRPRTTPPLRRLASRLGDHRGREVDADDVMTEGRQLEAEKPRAAAGVERVDAAAGGKDEIEDAVPGRALGGRADAVAEVLVEVRRPPIPVGGDLSLDDVSHYAFSMTSICTPSGAVLLVYVDLRYYPLGRPLTTAGATLHVCPSSKGLLSPDNERTDGESQGVTPWPQTMTPSGCLCTVP